jgi:hypothetical protein
MRKFVVSLVLAGAVVTAGAPAVLGHECYIANRSAQGDAGALHSANWTQLSLATIFGFINQFVGGPALTQPQMDWAVSEAVAQGLPSDGWVVRSDKVIGENSSNPNLANGKGLDHLADTFGPQLIGIYFAALGH